MAAEAPKRILAFCHIPKTGGQTIVNLLRRNFGVRHMDVQQRGSFRYAYYDPRDMATDLRLYPWVRSLHGHGLQPWIDYGRVSERLAWYTILRDPVPRLISAYQYSRETLGRKRSFQEYLDRFPSLNFAVRYLTGGDDLGAAKALLEQRFAAVGLIDHFDASLLIIRESVGVPTLDVRYARPSNASRSKELRQEVEREAAAKEAQLLERTALDRELLDFVRSELWPEQVRRYGEERLTRT